MRHLTTISVSAVFAALTTVLLAPAARAEAPTIVAQAAGEPQKKEEPKGHKKDGKQPPQQRQQPAGRGGPPQRQAAPPKANVAPKPPAPPSQQAAPPSQTQPRRAAPAAPPPRQQPAFARPPHKQGQGSPPAQQATPPQMKPAPKQRVQNPPQQQMKSVAPKQIAPTRQAQPPAGTPPRTAPAMAPKPSMTPPQPALMPQKSKRDGFRPENAQRNAPAGTAAPAIANQPVPKVLKDITAGRRVRTEAGGRRRITEEPGNRTIIRQDNRVIIRHDETERFRRLGSNVRTERRPNGRTVSILSRPGGVQILSYYDPSGNLIERRRRYRDGREVLIIDNRRVFSRGARIAGAAALIGLTVALAAPRIAIPRERYIVDYERASVDDLYDTLIAPPVDRLPRLYALEEIRYSHSLRERVRRVDLDAITFEFGSWEVPYDQRHKLERIARAMQRVLDRRPDDVFLIEGHTDLVGSDEDNLTLSDRRAESVAVILTEVFAIPPENLVTQGYGEQYPKIDTRGPERLNRRVAIRNITSLMARGDGPRR